MGLLRLMWEFVKIGMFAIGGGPATIPFLYDLAKRFDWFTVKELTNMIAISQCTPGPVGINMSTFVGYTCFGLFGGIMTTFAIVFPSLVSIIIIYKALKKFEENKYVKNAFAFIRPCVVGFILSAVLTVCSVSIADTDAFNKSHDLTKLLLPRQTVLFILLSIMVIYLERHQSFKNRLLNSKWLRHPIFYMVIAMVAGIVLKF